MPHDVRVLKILLGVVTFALWVFCLVDAISAPADRVRNLPKVAWVLLVLFFPFVGSVAWLVAGRPQAPTRPAPTSAIPESDRPGRFAAADPEKDEEFLRQIRKRAEEQRRRYEQSKQAESEPEPDPDAGEPTAER